MGSSSLEVHHIMKILGSCSSAFVITSSKTISSQFSSNIPLLQNVVYYTCLLKNNSKIIMIIYYNMEHFLNYFI